ncbi:Hypothetical protein PBC10988_4640 [Planctomycetales bacterium 10988]|nr:Hypothetical protein PBC10988_4640 [Planctomycetales bacterium 10988]
MALPTADNNSLYFDLVIYGATPAGISAAVSASRGGAKVALIESSPRGGGLLVEAALRDENQLSPAQLGGLWAEFCQEVQKHYSLTDGPDSPQRQATVGGRYCEPKVAKRIFERWLKGTSRVRTYFKSELQSVELSLCSQDQLVRIQAISTLSSDNKEVTFQSGVFLDASYDGALAQAGGVRFRRGRESRACFGERWAGQLANGDTEYASGTWEGSGQAIHPAELPAFPFLLTRNPEMRFPILPPEGYKSQPFEFLLKKIQSGRFTQLIGCPGQSILEAEPLPNQKVAARLAPEVAIQILSKNFGSAESEEKAPCDPTERWETSLDCLKNRYLQLMFYLQNDLKIPHPMRVVAKQWGLPLDEFVESNHLPATLDMRGTVRLLSKETFTEASVFHKSNEASGPTIAISQAPFSARSAGKLRANGEELATGGFFVVPPPFEIPLGILLPREVANLLVVGTPSASFVGMTALRYESTAMLLGQAAAIVGWTACEEHPLDRVRLDQFDRAKLQKRFLNQGLHVSLAAVSSPSEVKLPAARVG